MGIEKTDSLLRLRLMKKEKLKGLLIIERDKLASKTFEELSKMEFPITYQVGSIKNKDFYQFEIDIAEKTNEYIDIIISIDDGSLWRSLCPITTGFIVYKNGKVVKYKGRNDDLEM